MTRTLTIEWVGPADSVQELRDDSYAMDEQLNEALDAARTGKNSGSNSYDGMPGGTVELRWSLGDTEIEQESPQAESRRCWGSSSAHTK